jgi:hypothetical protein
LFWGVYTLEKSPPSPLWGIMFKVGRSIRRKRERKRRKRQDTREKEKKGKVAEV